MQLTVVVFVDVPSSIAVARDQCFARFEEDLAGRGDVVLWIGVMPLFAESGHRRPLDRGSRSRSRSAGVAGGAAELIHGGVVEVDLDIGFAGRGIGVVIAGQVANRV